MQSGRQGYCSMAGKNAAASSENVVLPETLGVTADVPNWSVSESCTHHRRALNACRFLSMYSVCRYRTLVDRCGMRHDTVIGA